MAKDPSEIIDLDSDSGNGGSEGGNTATPDMTPSSDGTGLIEPAAEATDVKELYDKFSEMKSEIISGDDTQTIGNKTFITKSGWRKVATAFNVSVNIVDRETWTEEINEHYEIFNVQITAKATAPNGKSVTSVGVCSSNESNFLRSLNVDDDAGIEEAGEAASKYVPNGRLTPDIIVHVDGRWRMVKPLSEVNIHDIIATASTRAKNRSISDLVGGGEVSAEEMSKEDFI